MNDTLPLQPTDATADATATRALAAAAEAPPLKPRVGTIVWGFLLLVVAVIAVVAAQYDFGELGAEVFVWSIVGLGAALVLAAIIAAIAKAARSRTSDRSAL